MGFTCAMVRHGTGPPSPGCISMEEAILLHTAVNGGPSGPGTGLNEGSAAMGMGQQRRQPFVPMAQRGGGAGGQIPGMQFLGGSQPLPPTFEQRFGSGLTAPTTGGQFGQPNSLAFPAGGARQTAGMAGVMQGMAGGMPGAMPGMMPGPMSGGMPGAMPGMMPGAMAGGMPGIMAGGMAGPMPGMMAGGMGGMPPGGMPPGAMAGANGMVPGMPIPPVQSQTTGFVDPTTGQQAFPTGLNGPSSGAVSAAGGGASHDSHSHSNLQHGGSGGSNAGFGGAFLQQHPVPGELHLHGGAASAPAPPSIGGHVSTIQEDLYGYYYLFNAGPDGSGGTRVNITKDGFCNKGHTHEQMMCVNMCYSDDQCPRNLKCCPSRCALDCIDPVIPTEQSLPNLPTEMAPPHSDSQAGVMRPSCEPCSSHLNCAGNTYCAMSSFCGNQMVCQPLQ